MAPQLIAFPFRLGTTGAVATVEQDSDAEVDQQIAVALLTVPGERDQVPTFGTSDPVFAGFAIGALQRHLLDFGPDVEVEQVTIERVGSGQERVTVEWTRRGEQRETS